MLHTSKKINLKSLAVFAAEYLLKASTSRPTFCQSLLNPCINLIHIPIITNVSMMVCQFVYIYIYTIPHTTLIYSYIQYFIWADGWFCCTIFYLYDFYEALNVQTLWLFDWIFKFVLSCFSSVIWFRNPVSHSRMSSWHMSWSRVRNEFEFETELESSRVALKVVSTGLMWHCQCIITEVIT